MNKAVILTRVSTCEQETSIEMQIERLKAYCLAKGLEVVEVVTDSAVSGSVPLDERDGGKRIKELIDAKAISHIVGFKLDRMFRDAGDCLTKTKEWEKSGIACHMLDIGVDTTTAQGRFFLTIVAGFAEMERRVIADRTKNAMEHKKKHKQVYSAPVYGFDSVDGALQPNEGENRTVRLIQRLKVQGKGYRAIANHLNEKGIKSKTGGVWHFSAVRNVLSNSIHKS
ncbi:MAG: recombinase family protein [Candidatus Hydrogenedentes bacterium]|nr:recombinase family protein [Candidatus Hydrogenedentota bacterium]